MRGTILAAALVLGAATVHAQASPGDAVDQFIRGASKAIGAVTRDGYVRSMVKQGFKCRGSDGPAVDVMCSKHGVGQAAKFGGDGTAKHCKLFLPTADMCKTALWHLEARFGKPHMKDKTIRGWFISKTRMLAFYDLRDEHVYCDLTVMRAP